MYVCKFCNTEFSKYQLEEKCICGKLNPNFVSREKLKSFAILNNNKQIRKLTHAPVCPVVSTHLKG